jgi:pyruvate/2-oxoglutarate dehydrogenase complex dihydrolipoamide dehydrogenase (E3) component
VVAIRHESLLRHFDPVLGERLLEAMRASGIEVVTEFVTRKVTRAAGGIELEAVDDRVLPGFDQVLWAIGRAPHTADLGLPVAGVATDTAGYVTVDRYQNTSTAGI